MSAPDRSALHAVPRGPASWLRLPVLAALVVLAGCPLPSSGPGAPAAPAPSAAPDSDVPVGTQGGPCRPDDTCDSLLRCDRDARRCVVDDSVGTAYGPCYPNQTCNGNLVCDVEIDTCAPPPQLGHENGPCYANGTCDGNLVCRDGRCRIRPASVD